MEPIFLYSFLVVISSIIFSSMIYNGSKSILNLGIIFNVFIVIYGIVGINTYWFVFNSNLEILEEIIKVIFISSIAFNLFFRRTKSLDTLRKVIKTPNNFTINLLFTIITISYLGIMLGNGILFVDRTEAFSLLYQNKYIFLLSSFQIILYIIIAFNYYIKGKASFFYVATLYLFFMSILTISRHDLFAIFVINVFFLLKTNKLSSSKLMFYSILLLLFFLFFKQILYAQVLGIEYTTVGADYGEVINWVRNTVNALNTNIEYEYNPYLVTLEGLFNPYVSSNKPLTNWYMENLFYQNYLDGNKYGFSFIGESYIAGSPYLLIIVFSFYGYLFKKVSFKNVTTVNSVIQIIIILMMYKLFRSESYNFFRSITWSYLIPLVVIQLFSIFNTHNYKIKS